MVAVWRQAGKNSIGLVVVIASTSLSSKRNMRMRFEYLRGEVTYAAAFSNSSENNYNADTANFSISQIMFADLSTVTLAFSRGWDDARRRDNPVFRDEIERCIYWCDISQPVDAMHLGKHGVERGLAR